MKAKTTTLPIGFELNHLRVMALICLPAYGVELPSKALSGLGSQDFRERETAQVELLGWARGQPEPAMAELLRQSTWADDPEVRERCLGVLRDLVTDRYLKEGEGYIGIGLKDEISEIPGELKPRGVIRVLQVQPKSPAELAGIRENDLIVGINGEFWHELLFRERIRMMKPETKVDLKVLRDGGLVGLKVTLGRRPLSADMHPLSGQPFNPDAIERAAKEAYFRRWLSQKKLQK